MPTTLYWSVVICKDVCGTLVHNMHEHACNQQVTYCGKLFITRRGGVEKESRDLSHYRGRAIGNGSARYVLLASRERGTEAAHRKSRVQRDTLREALALSIGPDTQRNACAVVFFPLLQAEDSTEGADRSPLPEEALRSVCALRQVQLLEGEKADA